MLGKPVPAFSLPSTGAAPFKLCGLRGSKVALYFHPRDGTPGIAPQHVRKKIRGIERSASVLEGGIELC